MSCTIISHKTNFNLNTSTSNNDKERPTNKIAEEENRLAEMNKELKKKKSQTVYLNFCRFIMFKKQKELNLMIEKIKKETGVDDLGNLSTYLEISLNTNKLFETDLKKLNDSFTQSVKFGFQPAQQRETKLI